MTIKQLREFVNSTKALEMKDTEEAEEAEEAEEKEEEVTTADSCNVATKEDEAPRGTQHFATLKDLSIWVNALMTKREKLENIDITFDVTTEHTEY